MFVCRVSVNNGTGDAIVGTYCCATITSNHISARMAKTEQCYWLTFA
jgi:hypothetical protein